MRQTTLFLFLCASVCGQVLRADTGSRRPNIVFLLTDDQTIGAVGCYGNQDIITPNMDSLAREGVRFANHYNTTSICMASRASVMTGLYEYRHGCNFGHGELERRFFDNSYPVKLRRAGYFTGFAGKIGFVLDGEKFEVLAKEFDVWAGGPGQTDYATKKNEGIAKYADRYPHCSRAYGAWADDFVKTAKQSGKPFCMNISFKAPHLPFTPDPIDLKLYESKKTFTRPLNYGVEKGTHLSPQVHTSRAATGYREWVNDYDNTVRRYYALITGADAALGMIRETLQREGLEQNTVILFTSDNGYNSGSHGFGDKVIPYEEGSKSPLIIYDPRLPKEHAGKVCEAVTGNVDMTATIFALAGVAAPDGIDGKNLLPLLTNPAGRIRDWLPLFNFWGAESAQSMAVVSPEWKYIFWYYAGRGMTPTEELFHLAQDRIEMLNLANDPRRAAELAAARNAYDAELAALKAKVVKGHGHEPYPVLFDRTAGWEKKEPLLKMTEGSRGEVQALLPEIHQQLWQSADREPGRQTRRISGWTVHVSAHLLDEEPVATAQALELLQSQLDEIAQTVPPAAVAELQRVPLWISPEYPGVKPRAEYHPNAGWLRENGRDVAMAKGVEFTNVRIFAAETRRMPNFALHELAHAYHDRVLGGGFDNPEIEAAYEKAKAGGKYDRVERWHGNGRPNTFERAYGMQDGKEYFAETSEAFFSRNDFFPFTRDELKQHDPEMFALLVQLWGMDLRARDPSKGKP